MMRLYCGRGKGGSTGDLFGSIAYSLGALALTGAIAVDKSPFALPRAREVPLSEITPTNVLLTGNAFHLDVWSLRRTSDPRSAQSRVDHGHPEGTHRSNRVRMPTFWPNPATSVGWAHQLDREADFRIGV
jgi:hypothetical protein